MGFDYDVCHRSFDTEIKPKKSPDYINELPSVNKAERGFGLLARATKPSETAIVH